mgnify:CR=1 FL=1
MKSIILFRHGIPESYSFGRDHDRPLAPLGITDSKKMGKFLSAKKELPDRVITSTALRAITTAEIAMAEGKWPCSLIIEEGIYGGPLLFLLNLVREQDDKIFSICLVGHEPNFSNFIARSTDSIYQRFPKASMAKINFDVIRWKNISMGFGKLNWLVRPADL